MSNRKVVLELLKTNVCDTIWMGRYIVQHNGSSRKKKDVINPKYYVNTYWHTYYCWVCKKKLAYNLIYCETRKNNHKVIHHHCEDCRNKTLCFGCLREVSHCKLIHTRKLLCYKLLLSQKFPKDIIKLITKKVK